MKERLRLWYDRLFPQANHSNRAYTTGSRKRRFMRLHLRVERGKGC